MNQPVVYRSQSHGAARAQQFLAWRVDWRSPACAGSILVIVLSTQWGDNEADIMMALGRADSSRGTRAFRHSRILNCSILLRRCARARTTRLCANIAHNSYTSPRCNRDIFNEHMTRLFNWYVRLDHCNISS